VNSVAKFEGERAMSNGFVRVKSASIGLAGGAGQLHSYLNVWVKVKNVAYSKDVQIHYRDSGAWRDTSLTWKSNHGNYDLFALEPALDFGGNPFVEFAIRLAMGGATYWDNNNFANYSLTPYALALTGGNVTLNIARLIYGGTPGSSYITGIGGEMFVNNLSYNKNVGIRHSDNGWVSYLDIPASYNQPVGEGGSMERWVFGRDTSPRAFGRGQFAVYYQNRDTGQYFWDNNFGQSYDITDYQLE
jgi:hypothetical protein